MNLHVAYRTGAFLARRLPRPFAYWVGLRMADVYYRRNGPDRAAIISNLRQIYAYRGISPSTATLEGVARKTFQHFGKYLVDFFRYAELTERDMASLFSLEHYEHLTGSVASGRGLILATAHLGNWEMGGAFVAAKGVEVHSVFLPERLEEVNRFFIETRSRRGYHLIPYGSAAREVLRLLRAKRTVALLMEREFSNRDDRVPFFGRPARFPRGPAMLAMKTGALILPGFLLRQVDDTFLMRIHKPLDPLVIGDEYELQRQLVLALEQEVGENPHQWYIFSDFWQ